MAISLRRRVPAAIPDEKPRITGGRVFQPGVTPAVVVDKHIAKMGAAAQIDPDTSSNFMAEGVWQPIEPWQRRALNFERAVGEFGGAANYMEYAVGKIRFRAGVLDDAGGVEPDDDENAKRLAMQLDQCDKGRIARQLFVAADAYLVVKKTPVGFKFEPLSIVELIPWQGGFAAQRHPSKLPELLYTQGTPAGQRPAIYRIWKPDTEYGERPMGWAGRVLDHLEALVLMTLADKAVSLSRLAGAGILYLPDEAVLPGIANESETGRLEPSVLDRLTDGMVLPIADRGNPDSLVPIVLTGPAEYADKLKHLTFERTTDPRDFNMRREVHLRAVATASDLPATKFLNTDGDGKFWNAWQTDRDTSRGYVLPYAQLIADGMRDWYRYILRALGHKNANRAVIWPDDSALVTVPDSSNIAIQLRQMGLIKRTTVVETCGFSIESDLLETDSDEYREWLDVTLAQNQRLTNIPKPGELPGLKIPGSNAEDQQQQQLDDKFQDDLQDVPDAGNTGTGKPTGQRPPSSPPGVAKAAAPKVTASLLPPAITETNVAVQAAFDSMVEQLDAAFNRHMKAALRSAGAKVASAGTKARSKDPVIAAAGERIAAVCAQIPDGERHRTAALVGRETVMAALGDEEIIREDFEALSEEIGEIIGRGEGRFLASLEKMTAAVRSGESFEARFEAYSRALADRRAAARKAGVESAVAIAKKALYDKEQNQALVSHRVARRVAQLAAGARRKAGLADDGAPELVARDEQQPVNSFSDSPEVVDIGKLLGFRIGGFRWVREAYGVPAAPFEPHVKLAGATFGSWDDPVIATDADHAWIGSYYRPGDHTACRCTVEVIWAPAS